MVSKLRAVLNYYKLGLLAFFRSTPVSRSAAPMQMSQGRSLLLVEHVIRIRPDQGGHSTAISAVFVKVVKEMKTHI